MPEAAPERLHVLLVEDDLDIAAGLVDYFGARGIEVEHAFNAREARARLLEGRFDLWLFDVQLPGEDGLSLCRRLKAASDDSAPVLFLTARGALVDRLAGFEAGAIDYVVKPFEPAELVARVYALARHLPARAGGWIEAAGWRLDPQRGLLQRDGQQLQLGASATRLLKCLMQASPGCVSRAELGEAVWGTPGEDDDLRTHLYALRRSLRESFGEAPIHSERGLGVRFGGPA
ncbi:response regulator transcription factor [Aquimonas sp.]|uniref:response regulator transcription factor n=1 Tax=Aquimonas sp. TaxID=1872588 RepID=UPI0037BFD577